MINTVTLGWIIVALGLIATVAGIVGAIIQLIKILQAQQRFDVPTDILTALRLLIEALIRAPVWLVLLLFGFALLVYGGTLIK